MGLKSLIPDEEERLKFYSIYSSLFCRLLKSIDSDFISNHIEGYTSYYYSTYKRPWSDYIAPPVSVWPIHDYELEIDLERALSNIVLISKPILDQWSKYVLFDDILNEIAVFADSRKIATSYFPLLAFTNSQLKRYCGISPSTISHWDYGGDYSRFHKYTSSPFNTSDIEFINHAFWK